MPKKQKSIVGVAASHVRYDGVTKALELIEGSVAEKLSNSMRIVIKPDFFLTKQGMSASADAVKAVLDFVLNYTNKKITIAEGLYNGAAVQPVFHRAGLHELAEDYGLKFVDLNRDEFVAMRLTSNLSLRVAKTVINSDFRISLAVPKLTGSRFSGAVANIAVGGVISSGAAAIKNDKARLPFFDKPFSLKRFAAVAELLKVIRPNLSVVDGFKSAVNSRSVETNFCAASADGVAADVIATAALGNALNKKISRQKYLELFSSAGIGQSSLSKITVAGEASFR